MAAETERPMARFVTDACRLHHSHLVISISEIEPAIDAHFQADAFLAPLAAQYGYQRRSMTPDQIKRVYEISTGPTRRTPSSSGTHRFPPLPRKERKVPGS